MESSFADHLYKKHLESSGCPSRDKVARFFKDLVGTLFPDFADHAFQNRVDFDMHIENLRQQLRQILIQNSKADAVDKEGILTTFFDRIEALYETIEKDVEALESGDPAAGSKDEVIRTYPGFYAIAAYRIAHQLQLLSVPVIPRMITEHAHSQTGIDIHPGAQIDEYFCIDHGTGIVIGETSVIGRYVKIYQGVTLGALSVRKEDASKKRHPTIEDHVVIYAGATILGGDTVIGHHSVVGGNVWITKSLGPNSKVYYQAKMHYDNKEELDRLIFKMKDE